MGSEGWAGADPQVGGLGVAELSSLTVGSGTVGCWRERGDLRRQRPTHWDLHVAFT